MASDITRLQLSEVASLIARREISPVEVVDEALKSIQEHQELNAFISVFDESARSEAKRLSEELLKGPRSPLHGIPVALKDLYYTAEGLTTAGSKILADFRPGYDASVTEKLKKAGAIIIGKTNTHEFAFGPTTEDSHFGPTRNPWDPSRISGGSSGGSGVAVAAGMSYAAMGTDTGGSVRIPSCLCGIVGFKPTFGRVSLFGVVPLSFTFDHAGPLTRSVKDAALVMQAIAGHDEKDPRTLREVVDWTGWFESKEAVDLKGVRIGVPCNFFFDKAEPDVEHNVRAAIKALADLGADIREVTIPELEDVPSITTTVMFAEAAYNHKEALESREGDYGTDVLERLKKGQGISAVEYIDALKKMDKVREAYEGAFEEVDVIATPSLPVPAYPIGSRTIQVKGVNEPAREMMVRHTRLGNLTGAPALTVPCGFTNEGLPSGLQIMGKKGDDLTVLRVGALYQKSHPISKIP